MTESSELEYSVAVEWEGAQRYRGGVPGGPTMLLDGSREDAPSPVEALLVALASCSAIDVVDILEKRRTPAAALKVSVDFARAPEPPRRVTAARLRFAVEVGSARHHVERAVELSIQKYCSVASTFAADTAISWTVDVAPPDTDAGG